MVILTTHHRCNFFRIWFLVKRNIFTIFEGCELVRSHLKRQYEETSWTKNFKYPWKTPGVCEQRHEQAGDEKDLLQVPFKNQKKTYHICVLCVRNPFVSSIFKKFCVSAKCVFLGIVIFVTRSIFAKCLFFGWYVPTTWKNIEYLLLLNNEFVY